MGAAPGNERAEAQGFATLAPCPRSGAESSGQSGPWPRSPPPRETSDEVGARLRSLEGSQRCEPEDALPIVRHGRTVRRFFFWRCFGYDP